MQSQLDVQKIMDAEEAGKRAASYFGEGYHCAEAVVSAFFESLGDDPAEAVAHATPFGGGFGKTFGETCGVLSGCMIAIGHVCGRRARGESWDRPAEFGAALRQWFLDRYGTTNCGVLRERFGEEQMAQCRLLVREGTVALLGMYRERTGGDQPGSSTPT